MTCVYPLMPQIADTHTAPRGAENSGATGAKDFFREGHARTNKRHSPIYAQIPSKHTHAATTVRI